jgi:hypothetical protein
MSLEPLHGFQSFNTHHCVTGSIRHVYAFNRFDVSEDLLLGIGSGMSFGYWHFKGQLPFLGGRNLTKPSMEELAGQRTGVKVSLHTTTSLRKATQSLLEMLENGQPVMVMLDMGFLPYFDWGGAEYHFGAHAVVICGYDAQSKEVLAADRDGLHLVLLETLEKARSSTFKPFPPHNLWYTFDFSQRRTPTRQEVFQAIREQCRPMLEPPIRNIGVEGIRKAAEMIPHWKQTMDAQELRSALFNAYIFVSPVGGSGGGIFRYMYNRFLREAAALANEPRLEESAIQFLRIADCWAEVGEWFRRGSEAPDPASRLGEVVAPLEAIAELEQEAWRRLSELAQSE